MSDLPETTFQASRTPLWSRENLKRVTAAAPALRPALRYVPKNPLFLVGAAVIGVAGVLAWRNRERIAQRAQPMLDDAKARAQPLLENAMAKAQPLLDNAAATGEALREKLPFRKTAQSEVTDYDPVH